MNTLTLTTLERLQAFHAAAAAQGLSALDSSVHQLYSLFDELFEIDDIELLSYAEQLEAVSLTPTPIAVVYEAGWQELTPFSILRLTLFRFAVGSLGLSEHNGAIESVSDTVAADFSVFGPLACGDRPDIYDLIDCACNDFVRWLESLTGPPSQEELVGAVGGISEAWMPDPLANPGAYLAFAFQADGLLDRSLDRIVAGEDPVEARLTAIDALHLSSSIEFVAAFKEQLCIYSNCVGWPGA